MENNVEETLGTKNKLGNINLLENVGITPTVFLMFALIALAPIFIKNQYYIHVLVSAMMFGTLGMGFDFTGGIINIVNFGYAAFMGTAAYTSGILAMRLGLSPWLGLIAGAIICSLLGLFIGVVTLRLRGIFAAILAWFMGMGLRSLATNWVSLTRGSQGLIVDLFFDTASKIPYYYLMFAILILTYVVLHWVLNTNIGFALRAIGQDQDAAMTIGINPTKYKIIDFTISSAVAGVVGAFYAHFIGIITPEALRTSHALEILIIAYVGGRGSIWGSILAAFILIPLLEILRGLGELKFVIYGVLLILIMIYYPGGLASLWDNMKNKFSNN